jgi:hypothetical protein
LEQIDGFCGFLIGSWNFHWKFTQNLIEISIVNFIANFLKGTSVKTEVETIRQFPQIYRRLAIFGDHVCMDISKLL